MNNRSIILDYGINKELFESYEELKMKLVDNGYNVYSLINKQNRSKGITNDFIKYSTYNLISKPTDVVIKTLWKTNSLKSNKFIVISENAKILNAFKIYKIHTCMLVRYNETEYDLLSTFESPTFEKTKNKIKSN